MRQIQEEYEVSGSYLCVYGFDQVLSGVGWILGTIWEIIALCLVTWIAVKHFRDSDVLGLAWPESPGLGLALEGSGLAQAQARACSGQGLGQGLGLRPGLMRQNTKSKLLVTLGAIH